MNDITFYNSKNVIWVLYKAALSDEITRAQFMTVKSIIARDAKPYTFDELKEQAEIYEHLEKRKENT